MRRILPLSSHVEHIKPESLLRKEDKKNGTIGSDLDYKNMVACFPRDENSAHIVYGAKKKDKWWENEGIDFISPLNPKCENCFKFDIEGKISVVGNNPAAETTIRVLCLDHLSLTDDRRRVVIEYIYGPDKNSPLSLKKTEDAIVNIVKLQGGKQYHEFCLVVRDVLIEYKKYLQNISKKKKFAQAQKNKLKRRKKK